MARPRVSARFVPNRSLEGRTLAVTIAGHLPDGALGIAIYELDRWEEGGRTVVEGHGSNDLLAEFTGTWQQQEKRFSCTGERIIGDKRRDPCVKVQLPGSDQVYELPIVSEKGELEGDSFELGLVLLRGGKELFHSHSPAFVRISGTKPAGAYELKVHWEKPEHHDKSPDPLRIGNGKTWTLGFLGEVVVARYQKGSKVRLGLLVTKKSGALPDKMQARVEIVVHNRFHDPKPEDVYRESQDVLLLKGQASVLLEQDRLLRDCDSAVNHNGLQATVTVHIGPGAVAGPSKGDTLHIMLRKLVLLLPGVCGSRIMIGDKGSIEPFPEWSQLDGWKKRIVDSLTPNCGHAMQLECSQYGVPLHAATRLDMFVSFRVVDAAMHSLEMSDCDIYTCVDNPENILYHTLLKYDGKPVPYYVMKSLPYDWRLKLDSALECLRGETSQRAPDEPVFNEDVEQAEAYGDLVEEYVVHNYTPGYPARVCYQTIPSLKEVIAKAKSRYGATMSEKVVLAGHSTGGLIALGAIQDDTLAPLISDAVFIDVPFFGAAKAYYAVLTGDMGIGFVSPEFFQRTTPNFPVSYHLAPTSQYPHKVVQQSETLKREDGSTYRQYGSSISRRDVPLASEYMTPLMKQARDAGYEALEWNEHLDREANAFHEKIKIVKGDPSTYPKIGIENCSVFWSQVDRKTPEDGTIHTLRLAWEGAQCTGVTYTTTDGDGTVPTASQKGMFPPECLFEIKAKPMHVPAPNDAKIWQRIAKRLDPRPAPQPRIAAFILTRNNQLHDEQLSCQVGDRVGVALDLEDFDEKAAASLQMFVKGPGLEQKLLGKVEGGARSARGEFVIPAPAEGSFVEPVYWIEVEFETRDGKHSQRLGRVQVKIVHSIVIETRKKTGQLLQPEGGRLIWSESRPAHWEDLVLTARTDAGLEIPVQWKVLSPDKGLFESRFSGLNRREGARFSLNPNDRSVPIPFEVVVQAFYGSSQGSAHAAVCIQAESRLVGVALFRIESQTKKSRCGKTVRISANENDAMFELHAVDAHGNDLGTVEGSWKSEGAYNKPQDSHAKDYFMPAKRPSNGSIEATMGKYTARVKIVVEAGQG